LGLFSFNAPYLPYVILAIEALLGQSWSAYDMLGIVIGHIYFYLTVTYPILTKRHLLKTPAILKHILDDPNEQ